MPNYTGAAPQRRLRVPAQRGQTPLIESHMGTGRQWLADEPEGRNEKGPASGAVTDPLHKKLGPKNPSYKIPTRYTAYYKI
jgi:hypothetical protein